MANNCHQCGKFTTNKKYCSRQCYWKSKRRRVERTCLECGSTFEKRKRLIEKGNGIYCSSECHHESLRNGEYRECEECGEEFYVKKAKIENGRGKYCSRECSYESRRLPRELRADSSYGPLWQDRRLEALARDSWTCQGCGIQQKKCRDEHYTGLHVHHKTPYREYDDDEKAHALDNLITLCPPCHIEVEQQT